MSEIDLLSINSRTSMVRFFDGFNADIGVIESNQGFKRPLVKTHLIETVDSVPMQNGEARLSELFIRSRIRLRQIDSGLFLFLRDRKPIGFLEQITPRLVALYSILDARTLNATVRTVIRSNSELDHIWISGIAFNVLWGIISSISESHRYTRIMFSHESLFDVDPEERRIPFNRELIPERDRPASDRGGIEERRLASFRLADRISIVADKLLEFQRIYEPLYAIGQIRIPSPVGPGGHDVYSHGQLTNRSESFRDHQTHVHYITRIYDSTLREMEKQAWYIRKAPKDPVERPLFSGAPVTIRFKDGGLQPHVFHRWIESTFRPGGNRFRLWGKPQWVGPNRVHVDAVDLHLWRPIFLDISTDRCILILPEGTCANTVHRLITNVQRYLDPGAEAFIGELAYRAIIKHAAESTTYEPFSG